MRIIQTLLCHGGFLGLCWVMGMSLGLAPAALGGGFGEKFRRFVLGPEVARQEVREPKLDESAVGCLRCHNGNKATAIPVKSAGAPMEFHGGYSVNHPIGMDYLEWRRKKPGEFRSLESSKTGIQLVDGRITCISCHRLKEGTEVANLDGSAEPGSEERCPASRSFAVGLEKDALCLTCHIK